VRLFNRAMFVLGQSEAHVFVMFSHMIRTLVVRCFGDMLKLDSIDQFSGNTIPPPLKEDVR
jgi:hypothetical protein